MGPTSNLVSPADFRPPPLQALGGEARQFQETQGSKATSDYWMNGTIAALVAWVDGWTLAQLVWLAPLAFALHIAEEAPGFTAWARRFANPRFTAADYFRVHVGGLILGFAAALLITYTNSAWVLFLYFTVIFLPGYVCNILFHAGATLRWRTYCPGLITAVVIYPPLVGLVVQAALRERRLTWPALLLALALAAALHTVEVARNTYGIDLLAHWLRHRRREPCEASDRGRGGVPKELTRAPRRFAFGKRHRAA